MSEGTPKAIEMNGIVRNATKIGVQDGQAEDLINLRFMDGSWRASGNGRQIVNMPTGTIYEQLYVHTNIYHHLLGVDNGTLYWFAEIDNDGVTFYPLDGTSDRSLWPEDKQDLPTERVALTNVVGDVWITQTGHLLTVIDESDDFEHLVYGDKKYVKPVTDSTPDIKSRELYPFGQVHFNYHAPKPDLLFEQRNIQLLRGQDGRAYKEADFITKHHPYLCLKLISNNPTTDDIKTIIKGTFGEIEENNVFSRPLLACAAVRYYDGSFGYASNPVLIYPRQQTSAKRLYKYEENGNIVFDRFENCQHYNDDDITSHYPTASGITQDQEGVLQRLILNGTPVSSSAGVIDTRQIDQGSAHLGYPYSYQLPQIDVTEMDGDILPSLFPCVQMLGETGDWYVALLGYDLVMSISDYSILEKNKDIFQSLCIFITPEVQNYDVDNEYTYWSPTFLHRPSEDIIYDLMHSPMFLLKEYKINELNWHKEQLKVDLSSKEDENILKNITEQPQLPIEATSRTTYLPKVSYMYNNRLHIANYKSYPFFGYPIDLFHLNNHSVKVQDGAWFKGVLPNLVGNNDEYLQYPKTDNNFPATIPSGCQYFAFAEVTIETSQGDQKVVRYIEPYNTSPAVNGRADFLESLNPLITYPDARAKHIKIVRYDASLASSRALEFDLKPHPYLNMAYYIDPDLKPISITGSGIAPAEPEPLPEMQNTEEYFPNGLKVSKTDQPMFFPVENTYQVGSAEILALMSNTIAVGTGQTGDAPLYVFCKDGVYALYVDASGQMAYPNARILARDVCNNPRSVTPIDAGVVFTTDRGLMMIAGEQVEEIGAPAEGDVVQFWNAGSVDYSKIATASMQQIAGLPSELCSTTDFLTYLQDKGTSGKAAIINYNHNMRELMVSNPNYPYSYVLDREGNWSRRDYTASQYVNNYPTSYRVDADGHFYKVDDEGDANTSLEHRKEADNKIFYLSNVIKLDSIGFKQAYRFVVRGYFETIEGKNIACVVEGSYDGRKFKPLGYNRKSGKFRDIGCIVERTDVRFFRVCLSGQVTGKTRIDYMEMSAGASMLNTKIR